MHHASITAQQATEKRTAKQLADFYGKYYQLKRENSEDLLDVFGFLNTDTALAMITDIHTISLYH